MNTRQDIPSNITPAATVILTREYAGELQVYLLKRNVNSGFMAGKFVFPGGTVEVEDRQFDIFNNHIDLSPDEIYHRLGGELSEAEALAFGVAAIRETLEEAGVFLAQKNDQPGTSLEHVRNLRLSDNLTKDWFVKLVVKAKWQLAISALSRWSHWITPESMKRRFDTRFLLAAMPPGQFCQPGNPLDRACEILGARLERQRHQRLRRILRRSLPFKICNACAMGGTAAQSHSTTGRNSGRSQRHTNQVA